MISFKKTPVAPKSTKELLSHIQTLEEGIEELKKELKEFRKDMEKAITKVSIMRYNPFREIGGDQSFSIALLDEKNDGVVVTSHYGHEGNRVYAKALTKGKSEHPLSEEEKKVVKEAKEQNNTQT